MGEMFTCPERSNCGIHCFNAPTQRADNKRDCSGSRCCKKCKKAGSLELGVNALFTVSRKGLITLCNHWAVRHPLGRTKGASKIIFSKGCSSPWRNKYSMMMAPPVLCEMVCQGVGKPLALLAKHCSSTCW